MKITAFRVARAGPRVSGISKSNKKKPQGGQLGTLCSLIRYVVRNIPTKNYVSIFFFDVFTNTPVLIGRKMRVFTRCM